MECHKYAPLWWSVATHPTEIRTSISPSSAVDLNTTSALANYATEAAVKRIFSQHTMRQQTERKYRQLPEVQNKKVERKRKEDYRTNRLMAEIFTRKLQKKVLKGQVNLSNSVSVIPGM
uniref:ALMS motif domain-containing protein n=1 Tax=Timema cristinae TaxID=61476 RepID=A0A7R9CTU9_TIMCR|nr:unnamed protein product [Timema cristinae]